MTSDNAVERRRLDLSILVCAFDMARELPRTIFTLSRPYQRGIEDLNYEIIILDNGSQIPVDEVAMQQIATNARVVRVERADVSPARAINSVMQEAKGDMLCLAIDGARMASPGLLAQARDAWSVDRKSVIGSLGFHLGPDFQPRSIQAGYDQSTEDALLADTPWRENGYTLFDISVLAGSSANGWFGLLSETNTAFVSRDMWDRLKGLDERFETPGGGLVNLDFWARAVEVSSRPWMILGEGTFHQVHGGAATNGTDRVRALMAEEYRNIHGHDFTPPVYTPRFIGALSECLLSKGTPPAPEPSRRAQSVFGRSFKIGLSAESLARVQDGTLRTRYKNLRFCKNPFDVVLYLRLLEQLRPQTIIEVGASEGGSAQWLIDQCRSLGLLDTKIISIDIEPPKLDIDKVRFFRGDANQPDSSFPHAIIAEARHPWLVIEDSAHTYASVGAVLNYFSDKLVPGDYMVVEDGVVADLPDAIYDQYEDGPNRAVREFLLAHAESFAIDTDLCDFFGHNVTYCPNAWLQRVRV